MDTVFEDCDLAELEIKNSVILVIRSDRFTPHFLLFMSLHMEFFLHGDVRSSLRIFGAHVLSLCALYS